MNKIQNIIATISIASLYITSMPAIANPSSHKIGFVKVSKFALQQIGTCGYRLVGDKNNDNAVLVTGVGDTPLMNIDGKNIALTLVSQKKFRRNNQIVGSTDKYKFNTFKITTDFRDRTTSQDRKGFGTREGGSIVVVSEDGWRKKIEVECAYDSGG